MVPAHAAAVSWYFHHAGARFLTQLRVLAAFFKDESNGKEDIHVDVVYEAQKVSQSETNTSMGEDAAADKRKRLDPDAHAFSDCETPKLSKPDMLILIKKSKEASA